MKRAISAAEAGKYLSTSLDLPRPISPQRMWHCARTGIIPVIRIGRRVWFNTEQLDAFIATGGSGYPTGELLSQKIDLQDGR